MPNIIIVITDDQGYGDLGCNGNKIIKTPHIDQFASQSVNFSNYHVGTTCSPTRAGLMTARNCLRNGVWHTNAGCSLLNQEEETIADVFSSAGYKTGMFGKWHLGDNFSFLPEQRGFQETFYHKGGGVGQTPDYWGNDYNDDTYFRNGVPEKTEGYCTDVFFEEALTFIKKSKSAPFLCYLSLNAPHSPLNVPEAYYNIYKDNPDLLDSQKRFYGMISNIDDNFGKLTNTLKSLGLMDNTILIFTTDNGTSNGYKYNKKEKKWYGYNALMKGTKTSEYDGGHRVPFIMHWKKGGFSDGKIFSGLSAHVDVLPTLAALAGVAFTPDKTIDGIDFSPFVQSNKTSERMLVTDTQRNQWPVKGKQSCVMYQSWRLVNGNELYNVNTDPGQLQNLFSSEPKMAIKLQDYYDSWWIEAAKEFKYSYIDIEPNQINTLSCHDIHVNSITAWDQKDIRKGIPVATGALSVNFKKSGTYEISLRRWPKETNLPLAAEVEDARAATPFWEAQTKGERMDLDSGFLKLGDKEYRLSLNPEDEAAKISVYISAGKTTMETGFWLKNGEKTTAFYTDISRKL
ncbi:MAG: arylsulfatase [Bacteroidota bacterium]|nr:arylsulfatase [Bacteroidota bacterium]